VSRSGGRNEAIYAMHCFTKKNFTDSRSLVKQNVHERSASLGPTSRPG
jgi:hypothetical protein